MEIDDAESIKQLVLSIPKLPVKEPKREVGNPSNDFVNYNSVKSVRMSTPIKQTYTFDSLVVFDPNADTLWPGAMVQGKSLDGGILAPINLKRQPGTITVTNLTVNPQGGEPPIYSVELPNPTNATAQAAVQSLVTQNITLNTPAKISYSAQQFFSLDHAMLQVGVSGSWLTGNVRADLGTEFTSEKSHFIVRFAQTYYSVSATPPSAPDSYLDGAVTLNDARVYMGEGNPPAYVSTVTYGRMLYFLVSSTATTTELRGALDAAFRSGFTSGEIQLTAKQREILQNSEIKVLALGGPSQSTVDLLVGENKLNGLKKYITEGINFSPESPGVPISYQVRYLRDNDVARLSLTTDYNIVDYRSQNVKSVTVTFNLTDDDKDKEEEIQLSVYKNDVRVGYGGFGGGTKWNDPGSYPCTVNLSDGVTAVDGPSLKVHMRKTPHGSATGNGMEGSITCSYTLEDGTLVKLFDLGERRYGDNHPFDLYLN